MVRSRQNFPDKQTQSTTTTPSTSSIDIVDLELHDLYTPIANSNVSDAKYSPLPAAFPMNPAAAPELDEVEKFKQDYFEKASDLSISFDLNVLKNVEQNNMAAIKSVMTMEDKKVYVDRKYSALIRPSRSELRSSMKQAVHDFRHYSVANVSSLDDELELQLFWDALERKMMYHMQAEVKKKNVTISLGHLRPQAMRLLEFSAPAPASSKFSDKSTKLYGTSFKYQLYTLVFKFKESKSDGYGIPSDVNKQHKWFLVKYQTEKNRWYFVKVFKATFMYDFLLQEVKVCISFKTWLHAPAGLVEGIEQDHWSYI